MLRDRTTMGGKNNKGEQVVCVRQVHRMHQKHRMQTTSENGRELSYCTSIHNNIVVMLVLDNDIHIMANT